MCKDVEEIVDVDQGVKLCWSDASVEDRSRYYQNVIQTVNNLHDSVSLDRFSEILKTATSQTIPSVSRGRRKTFSPIPGWNSLVKDVYHNYRAQLHKWRMAGKPGSGDLAVLMRDSRK